MRVWFSICNGRIVPEDWEGVTFILACELENDVEVAMWVVDVFVMV